MHFKKLPVTLLLILVFLELGLRLEGFISLSLQEYRNRQSIKQKVTYRILCVGGSTTRDQFPPFLEESLNQGNTGVRFSVIDKGRENFETLDILNQIEAQLDQYHPEMVVTMMGINEQGEHIPLEAATTSKGMLFIRSFRTYKLAKLLWLHILDKAKAIGPYKPDQDSRSSGKIQTYLPDEDALQKAVELNPKDANAYFALGKLYLLQDNYPQAEESLKKAIELNPKNENAYFELGQLYLRQSKHLQAEDLLKKDIEINPQNNYAYSELGWLYNSQGKFSQAEDTFKKAIERNPKDNSGYCQLGWFYRTQGKYLQAEDAFKKAIEFNFNPQEDMAYGAISVLYEEMGKSELAKEYAQKADRLRSEYYTPGTVNNYRKLKVILDKRGIRLTCVQYPMRSVEPLKRIFAQDSGVIFIDNERIFKEAIRQSSYKEYFRDMFAGDFGHCTPKGNRLLAQNIAKVILKEVFSK